MKEIKVGTLFSGIGAFEHALSQLGVKHKIQFACDNGERGLPITFRYLGELTQGLSVDEVANYCDDYVNKVGIKKEVRDIESRFMWRVALMCQDVLNERMLEDENRLRFNALNDIPYLPIVTQNNLDEPVVVKYNKQGRKSVVKHTLELLQEQIIQLSENLTMKERELFVNGMYNSLGSPNDVKTTYMANYKLSEKQWHEDLRFFDANEYNGKVDILVGGSPCQSFSNYGKKLGLEDARGTLFYDYARIIKECQPKVFIYENVENVTKNDNGRTWEVMLAVWKSLGYEIEWSIMNAKDYNHPQLRPRLFLIGFRKDIYTKPYKFPAKMTLTHKSTEYLEKREIPDIYYLGKKGFEWITTPSKNLRRSRVNQDIIGCETANQQDNWIGDFRVEQPKPHHYTDERIHVGKFDFKDGKGMVDAVGRKMTPRECLNLMGFDDTFKIAVPDSIAYRQAGNSIVVPVLKEIIKSLTSYL